MDAPYTLIANETSGRRDADRLEALHRMLEEGLGEPVAYRPCKGGEGISEAAKAARDAGHGTVFAAGGDGTLSGIADVLKGSDVAMAPLPMGTFNFFARGLDIPEGDEAAVEALLSGEVRDFPVGEINGRIFLNNASLGVYPAILRARETVYENWGRSRIAAYWSVFKILIQPGHGMRLTVEVDGQSQTIHTPMVFVGSNPFQLRIFKLDGAELPEEGQLAFYYGQDVGRFAMLRTALWLGFKIARKDREFAMLAGREIKVWPQKTRKVTAALDGERFHFDPPVTMRLLEHSLKVVAPRAQEGAGRASAA
ncbi:diacylglycerol kinase family protein [Pseudoroseicyclus sp. CXY001]|uniref:diacylglycerol/lipid kinase family protein n=1 Tax=Pseudoroseicyclus sp. CXY001 TaxID=3242492 RepID=UPI00357138FC